MENDKTTTFLMQRSISMSKPSSQEFSQYSLSSHGEGLDAFHNAMCTFNAVFMRMIKIMPPSCGTGRGQREKKADCGIRETALMIV